MLGRTRAHYKILENSRSSRDSSEPRWNVATRVPRWPLDLFHPRHLRGRRLAPHVQRTLSDVERAGDPPSRRSRIAFLHPNHGTRLYIPMDLRQEKGRTIFEAVSPRPGSHVVLSTSATWEARRRSTSKRSTSRPAFMSSRSSTKWGTGSRGHRDPFSAGLTRVPPLPAPIISGCVEQLASKRLLRHD